MRWGFHYPNTTFVCIFNIIGNRFSLFPPTILPSAALYGLKTKPNQLRRTTTKFLCSKLQLFAAKSVRFYSIKSIDASPPKQ